MRMTLRGAQQNGGRRFRELLNSVIFLEEPDNLLIEHGNHRLRVIEPSDPARERSVRNLRTDKTLNCSKLLRADLATRCDSYIGYFNTLLRYRLFEPPANVCSCTTGRSHLSGDAKLTVRV
jgi:hypothetical protein